MTQKEMILGVSLAGIQLYRQCELISEERLWNTDSFPTERKMKNSA